MPASAGTIHELAALVTSNVSGLVQGMRKSGKATSDFRKTWLKAGRDISAAATRIEGAVEDASRAIDAGSKSLKKYESALSRVGTAARARVKDLAKLEAAARRSASRVAGASAAMAAGGVAGAAGAGGGAGGAAAVMLPAVLLGSQKIEAAQARIARIASTQVVPAFHAANEALGRLSTTAMSRAAPAIKRLGDEAEIIDVEFSKRTIPLLGQVNSAQTALARVARTQVTPALESVSRTLRERLAAALASMRARMAAAWASMRDGIRSNKKAIKRLAKSWGTAARDMITAADRIGMAVGVAVAVIGGHVAKTGLEFIQMQQSATIAFTTMLEDGERARRFMGELQEFARKTPFELPGLISSAQKMLALGFAAKEVIPTLTIIGDQVSALGGNPETLERIIRAIGQIRAKGRAQAEELLQLTESGVAAYQILADQMGTTIPQLMDQVEKGLVSANEAIPALLAGMQKRTQGLMAQQNRTMRGQISTLKDNYRAAAGEIVASLAMALREWITRLNQAFASGKFRQFIQSAALQVREFVIALEDSWPMIKQTAQAFWDFLKPILAFLKEHPKLLAAMIALKVTGLMGLNTAAVSLAKAISQTITQLLAMKGASTALSGSLAFLLGPAGLVMAGVAAVALLSSSFETLGNNIKPINEQFAEMNRIMQRGIELMRERAGLARGAGPAATQADLETLKAEQSRVDRLILAERQKLQRAQSDEGSNIGEMAIEGLTLGNLDTPLDQSIENSKRTIEALKARAAAIAREIDRSEKALRQPPRSGATRPGGQVFPSTPQTMDAGTQITDQKSQAAAAQKAIRDAIAAGRREEIERHAPGFGRFRDMLGMAGITGRQVATLAGQQEGVTGDMARRFGGQFSRLGGSAANPQALDRLAVSMARMVSEQQRVAQATETARAAFEQFDKLLLGIKGTIPQEQFQGFQQQFMTLRSSLLEGSITTEQFATAMDRLRSATDESTAAAERKAQREREDALIAGNFAKAGMGPAAFRAAVQEQLRAKILEFRQGQWTNAIDSVVNSMLGIRPAAEQVAGGLRQFGQNLKTSFGRGGTISPGQVQSAWQRLQAFFVTTQGKIANLQNQLALNQQALRFASGQNRREIEETIEAIKESLHDLRNQEPVFSGRSGDGFFRDPGLAPAGGPAGDVRVQVIMPNITRITQTEADLLADRVAAANAQSGRRY